MEVRLALKEIRRLLRSSIGQAEAEAISGNNTKQLNALIDIAALEMHNDGPWPVAEVRTTIDLGQEQYKFAYPVDCDLGSIRELSICLADSGVSHYTPLEQRPLPSYLDTDQQEAVGGALYDGVQGEPRYWNQRGGFIFVFPVNDSHARKVRMAYQPRKTFANDDAISIVDGQCILYKALELYYGSIEDEYNSKRWEAKYTKRCATLRGFQNSGKALALDTSASFSDFGDPSRPVPNWDTTARPVTP